jgi:two-component system response regulator VicR
MVVDDDPGIQEVVKYMLESEGYEVISAKSGKEGLSLLEKVKPDYIFLDIMMPHMNGWEMLKELKSREDFKDIPVSMLTVKSLEVDMLENNEVKKLVDYVTKPFTKKDILETLNQIL